MLCRRVHHKAAPSNMKLLVDTGAPRTLLRTQVHPGAEFKQTGSTHGLFGGISPVMKTQAHLIFEGQLITVEVELTENTDAHEDGLLGLDLLRSMGLRDGQAELQLAAPADPYRSALDEQVMAEACGCWWLLRTSVNDRVARHRTGL